MRGFDALRALLGFEYSLGSWFTAVPINPLGGLSEDWPDGFLDVGARDAQKLLQAGLAKHRRMSAN